MSGNETVVLGPGGLAEPEPDGARDQVFAELVDRLNAGQAIDAAEVRERWPAYAEDLLARLREFEGLGMSGPAGSGAGGAGATPGEERAFGGYRILREVGRGGMGVVYEAIDKSLDRRVALKVLPPGLLIDERSVTRFQREARIAGKLRHPNVVQVHASGVHEKTPYIAMEFVEGESLEKVLARKRPSGPAPARGWASKLLKSFAEAFTRATPAPERGAAPAATGEEADSGHVPPSPIPSSPADMDLTYAIRMANLFAAVAEGLQHAHAAGVLHRDLKPSNLILDPQGNLRILDFGLARSEGQESLTASREIVGTPRYMSPEVARGFKTAVDHRTDIFSLGATLYEVLTLTPAFPGTTAQDTLSSILHHDPRPPRALNPRIPRDLETIVLKCLEKAPADRYGTAEALAQDLRRAARGDPIEARPQSAFEKVARRIRRHQGRIAAAAAILFLLAAAVWFGVKSYRQSEKAQLAAYHAAVAQAAGRIQMGVFAGQAGQFAWAGQGFDGMRLSEGLENEDASRQLIAGVVRSLEQAIAAYPGRPEARFHLGRLLLYQEDFARAESELRQAAANGSTPAVVVLAYLLEKNGRREEAAALRQGASGSREGRWAEAVAEAEQAAIAERWPEAMRAYEQAIEMGKDGVQPYPDAPAEVFLGSGIAHLQVGNHERARQDFQAAAALRPGALEPEILTGIAYRSEGNAVRAEEIFERLHARVETAEGQERPGGPNYVASWVTMFYWTRWRDTERALKWADRIPPSFERELWKATCLISLSPGPESIEAARKLTEMRPDVALSWFIAAIAHVGAGDFANGEEMAAKAAERAPRSSMPRQMLAEALRAQGKLAEAHAALLKAVEVEPDSAYAHFYLGISFTGQGHHAEAAGSFAKAIEVSTRTRSAYVPLAEAHLRLGNARLALGLKDEALAAFQQAVAAFRNEGSWGAPAHLALAGALFDKGERVEAIRVLEEALDSPAAHHAAATRLPSRLEEYARAVLPDLPTYRTVDLALARRGRTEVLAEGAPWKFWKGTAAPSPGLEWTLPGFDDSKWPEGPSGFGYGDDDDATVLDDMRGRFTTLYLRARFSPPDPAPSRLVVTVKADDGFIAYLNGVETWRHQAPDAVTVPHDATAAEEAVEPLLPVAFALDPALLSTGENRLAIQGLNVSPESSDFSLIPVLAGERPMEAAGVRQVLAAFQAGADSTRDAGRLAYLRGLAHAAEGDPERAAEQLAIAAGLDPERPEPALALAKQLRARGRSLEARSRLELLLAKTGNRALWDLWLLVSLADLKLGAGELLERLPAAAEAPRPADWLRGVPASFARDLRWLFTRLAKREAVRIRCGGEDWTSRDGTAWGHDRFFTTGALFASGRRRFLQGIEGTEDDAVYQTERYFPALAPGQSAYELPLPPGRYRVTLHFAEIYFRAPGQRVFDILLEGKAVLEGFDIAAAAGFATEAKRSFEVAVGDGRLEIGFRRRVQNPKVSAIEIEVLP